MTWIQTYTGIQFDLLNPTVDMIVIEDIAHALSYLCRFTGHTNEFYSVAQHSWLCSFAAPPEYKLEALLHDAHEAYTGDVNGPLKSLCSQYSDIQEQIDEIVRKKFGLPLVCSGVVKQIDRRMLHTERRDLFEECIPWDSGRVPYTMSLCPLDSKAAKDMFIESFRYYINNG